MPLQESELRSLTISCCAGDLILCRAHDRQIGRLFQQLFFRNKKRADTILFSDPEAAETADSEFFFQSFLDRDDL